MVMDSIIQVSAISSKGRSRIETHGDMWKVVNTKERGWLLRSMATGYERWLDRDDKDFLFEQNILMP
jgi:hypothetical protein